MIGDETFRSAKSTWSEGHGVSATFTGMTGGAFKAVLEIKQRLFTNRLDNNWFRLIPAGIFGGTKQEDDEEQGENGRDRVPVGAIETDHL